MRDLPTRKHPRLKGYDYSRSGAYHITVCIKDRHMLLWKPTPVGAAFGRLSLSEIGLLIDKEIDKIDSIYDNVKIDNYVIMPNHIHLLISLSSSRNADGRPKAAPTISRIMNQFKSSITKQLGYSIWQKLFHDQIIRNEAEYQHIWQYIDRNPGQWIDDDYFVERGT